MLVAMIATISASAVQGLPPSDPLIRQLSIDGHYRVNVDIETIVEDEGGLFRVTTIISGRMIERMFGVKEIVHTELAEERPSEGTEKCEIEILDPQLSLDLDSDVPSWSYEIYGNPALSMPVYVKADPINLVMEAPLSLFEHQMKVSGWSSSSNWDLTKANVNFVNIEGNMRAQSKNYFKDKGNGERYHLRVWRCGGILIGQAHIDIGLPHEACRYEAAEAKVVHAFRLHITRRNSIWLSNKCKDGKGYSNNGWASYIKTYKQYN